MRKFIILGTALALILSILPFALVIAAPAYPPVGGEILATSSPLQLTLGLVFALAILLTWLVARKNISKPSLVA
jgi:hypothetical protein